MGWVGHDLKTWEIICLSRWLVDFNFWVGLRWLGPSQMYVGWCVLMWSGLDPVIFGLDHLLSWVRIWLRPLENWLGILHEVGLSEPGRFFSRLDWPIQQINQLQMIYSSQSHFLFKSKSSIAKLLKPKKEERGGPWKPIFKILRQGKRSDHASKGPFSFLFFSFLFLSSFPRTKQCTHGLNVKE